jgi:hypothetical protein
MTLEQRKLVERAISWQPSKPAPIGKMGACFWLSREPIHENEFGAELIRLLQMLAGLCGDEWVTGCGCWPTDEPAAE